MSELFFPQVSCVRSAFTQFRPPDPLLFYKDTDIKPYWIGAFINGKNGAKHPPYETIVKIVSYLTTKHNVRFLPDGTYIVAP